MTIKELKEKLNDLPDDWPVKTSQVHFNDELNFCYDEEQDIYEVLKFGSPNDDPKVPQCVVLK